MTNTNLLFLTYKDLISIVTFEVAETEASVGSYEGKKLVRLLVCFREKRFLLRLLDNLGRPVSGTGTGRTGNGQSSGSFRDFGLFFELEHPCLKRSAACATLTSLKICSVPKELTCSTMSSLYIQYCTVRFFVP